MVISPRIYICKWLKGNGCIPGPMHFRSEAKIGRICLGKLPGLGKLELWGLKKNTDYAFSFHEDVTGCGFNPVINKIIGVEEAGSGKTRLLYYKQDGIIYLSGKPVEYSPARLAEDLRQWFDGKIGPPRGLSLLSDAQGRIFLAGYQRDAVIIKAGILPGTLYNVDFGQKENDLFVIVYDQSGVFINKCYLRFQGRFYHTARREDRAIKDFAPVPVKRKTRWHKTRERSKITRDFLEGKTENPGPALYTTDKEGGIVLTTLQDGQSVVLRGLGRGIRCVRREFTKDENGTIMAFIYEESGILNNYYLVKQADTVFLSPSPGIKWSRGKFVPEIAQIRDWLGLDENGRLKQPQAVPIDLEEAIKQAPLLDDNYQAAWYAQKIREQTGKEIRLDYIMRQLWLNNKVPRQALLVFSLAASQLELFIKMSTEVRSQGFSQLSIPALFEKLEQINKGKSLATCIYSLFIGGALLPRKKNDYYVLLAQAYQSIQIISWLRQAPDFGDNLAEALRYLALNTANEKPLSHLILALAVQGKIPLHDVRINMIAIAYIVNNLELIEKELDRGIIIVNKKGEKYDEIIEQKIRDLIQGLFGKDRAFLEKFKKLATSAINHLRQRPEHELYKAAMQAPNFKHAFEMAEWLVKNRVADYSLAYHLNYLLYCKKISEKDTMGFSFVAGAYDWLMQNQQKVMDSIKMAIVSISSETYPSPYLIAREIFKTQKWTRKGTDKILVDHFIYLVVMAAFRLNWQELALEIKKHWQKLEENVQTSRALEQIKVLTGEQKQLLIAIRAKRFAEKRQLLTQQEEDLLVVLSKLGHRKAQDYLLYFYAPFLEKCVRRFACAKMPFDDLMQIARIKLIVLSQRYDPNFGTKFMTYVFASLGWNLFHAVTRKTSIIHLPAHYIAEMRMIRKIELQLKQKLGRQLSVEELAKVLDMDLDELKVKIRLEVKIKSMHEPLAEDFNLEAILPDPTAKVEEAVVEKGLKEIVEKAIAQTRNLKDQERQVLTMRYLQGDTVISLAEVGRRLFLTRERVRQIENKALNKLAQGRYSKELRRYLDDSINL